jgi:hypothetical protein
LLERGGGPIRKEVDWFDPWVRARVAWIFIALAALPASALLWLGGGWGFCGTDTTEPGVVGDWACERLVHPVAPWALIAAMPLAILLVGGHVGLQRKSWRLFAYSVIGAPLLLVIGFFALMAIF